MKLKVLLGVLSLCAVGSAQANPVTRAEARVVAQQLVGIDDTTSDDNAPLLPYYIFSRGEGKGFVIVSGDDSTAPILGYTDQGNFVREELPPQLTSMLDQWTERLTVVQSRHQQPRMKAPRTRAIASYKSGWQNVGPLIATHWHQSSPYNGLAPVKEGQGRCMTGCVATAGAQVTYYYHRDNPNELQYDTPTYSYGTPITVSLPAGTPIEWDQMRLSGSGTERQNKAVATLMYALGTSAWLTYGDGDGTATSGHNEKMAEAMRGQFKLNSSHKWKSEYSQQGWEELIYKNLSSRQPMLYSGAKEDGGHSVVLDGYQASTGLYHFNFGWGGQGDGYYTVDDATGMNGFNTYQDLVFNITPQVQNLSGQVLAEKLWNKATNNVTVSVTNNGTLDYKGIYLYTNTRPQLPSSMTVNNLATVIESGKTEQLDFKFTPSDSQLGQVYLFLCDKSKNVLDTCIVEVIPTIADLHLEHISVDGSDEVQETDGMEFIAVNNTTATVTTRLTNGSAGTFCQPTFRCFLQTYDTASKTWAYKSEIMINPPNKTTDNPVTFEQGQTQDVQFVFSNLTPEVLYRAYLDPQAAATDLCDIAFDTPASMVYFTVRTPDLSVMADGRTAIVTGRWNGQLFSQLATDASVCSYDFSGLTQLTSQPQAANPNAVFYAPATASDDWKVYRNVVVGDVCEHLVLTTGGDFLPSQPFTARQADMVLEEAETDQWHCALLPFAAEIPYGMQVKQPDEESSTTSVLAHQHTLQVAAMTPVVYITSRDDLRTIVSYDVAVTTETEATAFSGRVHASTIQVPINDASTVLLPAIDQGVLCFLRPADGQTFAAPFVPVANDASRTRLRVTRETLADGYYGLLAKTINAAHAAIQKSGRFAGAALQTLQDELKLAEDMLTYRSHSTDNDILDEKIHLENALNDFLEAAAQGIGTVTNGQEQDRATTWFSLSGQRLDHQPAKGMFIVRQGGKARVVLLK